MLAEQVVSDDGPEAEVIWRTLQDAAALQRNCASKWSPEPARTSTDRLLVISCVTARLFSESLLVVAGGLEEAIDGGLQLMASSGGGSSTRDVTAAHVAREALALRLQAMEGAQSASGPEQAADALQAYVTLVCGCCWMEEGHALPPQIERACKVALRAFTAGRSFREELAQEGYREGRKR